MTVGHSRAPVGEAPATNPDALEYTVAGELVENEERFNVARHLVRVGNEASDKVRVCCVQRSQQRVELGLES